MRLLMDKWWPDRPWPLRVCVGDEHWGESVAKFCASIREDWLLVLMDDYWLQDVLVDTNGLEHCLRVAEQSGAQYVRVQPTPGPSEPKQLHALKIGEHRIADPYRCSLQAAWWRREYLARVAAKYANPWAFELQQEGDPTALHLSVIRSFRPMSYTEGLKRGEWLPDGERACAQAGVDWPGA